MSFGSEVSIDVIVVLIVSSGSYGESGDFSSTFSSTLISATSAIMCLDFALQLRVVSSLFPLKFFKLVLD